MLNAGSSICPTIKFGEKSVLFCAFVVGGGVDESGDFVELKVESGLRRDMVEAFFAAGLPEGVVGFARVDDVGGVESGVRDCGPSLGLGRNPLLHFWRNPVRHFQTSYKKDWGMFLFRSRVEVGEI